MSNKFINFLSMATTTKAALVLDGGEAIIVSMENSCKGCTFEPNFALGGMSGGIGIAGFRISA